MKKVTLLCVFNSSFFFSIFFFFVIDQLKTLIFSDSSSPGLICSIFVQLNPRFEFLGFELAFREGK